MLLSPGLLLVLIVVPVASSRDYTHSSFWSHRLPIHEDKIPSKWRHSVRQRQPKGPVDSGILRAASPDTYLGGSRYAFKAGNITPVGNIAPDPVRWLELWPFAQDDDKWFPYKRGDIVYEYFYEAYHPTINNTRYSIYCYCFPSEDNLCGCDHTPGEEFLHPSYLRHANPGILYIDDDSSPDDRYMDILSFALYLNGTFPCQHKKNELKDYSDWQNNGLCRQTLRKGCSKRDKDLFKGLDSFRKGKASLEDDIPKLKLPKQVLFSNESRP